MKSLSQGFGDEIPQMFSLSSLNHPARVRDPRK